MNDTETISEARALAWAERRKRAGETAMVSTCPCCGTMLAIYVDSLSTPETVPHTTDPTHLTDGATDSTSHNSG